MLSGWREAFRGCLRRNGRKTYLSWLLGVQCLSFAQREHILVCARRMCPTQDTFVVPQQQQQQMSPSRKPEKTPVMFGNYQKASVVVISLLAVIIPVQAVQSTEWQMY